jgi:nitrate reductase gamma subunit
MFSLDQALFAVLPYVAVAAFLLVIAARRCGIPPFGAPRPPAPPPEGPRRYGERLLFGCGILVILAGHLLAFLFPEQVLLWNTDPVRLYILEGGVLAIALLTLAGLLLTMVRCAFSAAARRDVGPADWALYALLLVQVAGGVAVALFHPWGSSWYAVAATPYLRSLVMLQPDLTFVSAMPHLVKLHVATAWVLVLLLPFTRVVRALVAPGQTEEQARAAGRVTTALLLVGLAFTLLAVVPRLWSTAPPNNDQGYEPVQPIAFSHRQHAGDLHISCVYCHSDADKGPHAGIPDGGVCMNCHRSVTAPLGDFLAESELAKQEKRPPRPVISPELEKLYTALALDDKLQPDADKTAAPIPWVKVHNLPSFTHFDHRAHVNAGVDCQRCHGAVESMERVRQVEDLSMGWCVNCHRDVNEHGVGGKSVHASNDCSACHH